jgi:hypothetical protein
MVVGTTPAAIPPPSLRNDADLLIDVNGYLAAAGEGGRNIELK